MCAAWAANSLNDSSCMSAATLLEAGPLTKELHDAIRARWKEASKPEWVGQT
jgi:hypothetical protein